jgi:predicted nucleic acid-binding protein
VIVVDTNILLYFLVPGDFTAQAEKVFRRDPDWAAPFLWYSEFRNALALYLHRKMLTLDEAVTTMERADQFLRSRTFEVNSDTVLKLAAASRCSAYDCEFVALAEDLRVPLVTADAKLASRFKRVAVSLASFTRPLI